MCIRDRVRGAQVAQGVLRRGFLGHQSVVAEQEPRSTVHCGQECGCGLGSGTQSRHKVLPEVVGLSTSGFADAAIRPIRTFGASAALRLRMVWLKFAAAMLASSLRALLGKLNEAMGLGIGIAVEVVANVEAEIPGFLFDLRRDHGRHRAGIHLAGDLGAQVIDDFEPPVPTLETPAHGGFSWVALAITEY